MDTHTQSKSNHHLKENSSLNTGANDLIHASKQKAHELWSESRHKVSEAQESIKDYSNEVIHKIQNKPVKSVFIAAGIGFLLATLLRR